MNENTIKLVWETRRKLRTMDDETTAMSVAAVCVIAAGIIGAAFGSIAGGPIGLCYGVGSFSALMFWIWMLIFARRAWLLARVSFEVASCDIENECLVETEPPPATAVPDPEPDPPPACPDTTPMEQITSDAKLMQLLLDMPTEKLQAIIDARSIRL